MVKKFLGGKHLNDDDIVKQEVQTGLSSQMASFSEEGIQTLVSATSASITVDTMWRSSVTSTKVFVK